MNLYALPLAELLLCGCTSAVTDDPVLDVLAAVADEIELLAMLLRVYVAETEPEGAHRACVLLGIVATCRAIGVPVQAYLTWAFERLGTHRDRFGLPLDGLTPAAFKLAAT